MQKKRLGKVVAIGGGHGLGRVLSALAYLEDDLTGIVTTTDNGGSTGRLRTAENCIAWGDIRNCINQLVTKPDIGSLLFEYRFQNSGELNNHNLGNLMLLALDNLCVRPLDAVNLIRGMLHIKCQLIPMSESPSDLIAITPCGSDVYGEVSVDKMALFPEDMLLKPQVSATQEAIHAIKQADVIILGPGSFLTSIVPPLLLTEIRNAIAETSAKVIYFSNLREELSPAATVSLEQRLFWLEDKMGTKFIDAVIQDKQHQFSISYPSYSFDLREQENSDKNDRAKLKYAITTTINNIYQKAHLQQPLNYRSAKAI